MAECSTEIICPYCGNNEGDGWDWDTYESYANTYSDWECSKCGREFEAMVEFHPYWYTKKREGANNDRDTGEVY